MFSAKILVACAAATSFALAAPVRAESIGDSDAAGAHALVGQSGGVVHRLSADAHFSALLKRAQGVFVVPDLVKGALIVGDSGGEGVLVVRADGHWSGPAFLSIGALSIGAQAGVEAGPVVMLLMTDKAVADFTHGVRFDFDGDANLTIVSWSPDAQASFTHGDVIIWSGGNGLFAGLDVGGSEAHAAADYDKAYYANRFSDTRQIIESPAKDANASPLLRELPG